jgi:hypothetical protein
MARCHGRPDAAPASDDSMNCTSPSSSIPSPQRSRSAGTPSATFETSTVGVTGSGSTDTGAPCSKTGTSAGAAGWYRGEKGNSGESSLHKAIVHGRGEGKGEGSWRRSVVYRRDIRRFMAFDEGWNPKIM